MKITDIRIHHIKSPKTKLTALASVVIDGQLVISGFQIFNSVKGCFVGMPSRKMPDGSWKEIVFPIDEVFSDYLKGTILRTYEDEISDPGFSLD